MNRLVVFAARAIGALTLVGVLVACGGDDNEAPDLSPEAEAGREITRTNGCAACHGSNGQGGVGPPFAGLYGSVVHLADGTTVVADEEYLADSIRQPAAKRVDGYELPMPSNELSEEEISSVIAYIRELSAITEATQP